MTLNGVMAVIWRYTTEFCSIGGQLLKIWLKIDHNVCSKNVAQRI